MPRRAPQTGADRGGSARIVNFAGGSARVEDGEGLALAAKGVASFAMVAHEQDVQRDSLVAARLQEGFKQEAAAELSKLDPLASDYNERVEEIFFNAREAATSKAEFKTRKIQDAFALALENQSAGGLTLAQGARRTALDAEGKRLRSELEDSVYASIRKDPDGYDSYLAEFSVQAQRVNPSINPKDLPQLNEKFADAALVARAEGYAERGEFDKAKELIDANQKSLTPETYRNAKRMVREAETRQKQDYLASTAAQAADLEVKIIDAKTNADFTRLRGEVEALDTAGFFKGREEKKVSMIRQIEHQREIVARREQYVAVRLDQFDRGMGSNNQQDADLVWEQVAERHRAKNPQASTDQWVAWAGQYAAQSGWVPSQYRNVMANAERTDNPALVESAARLYDKFRTAAPEADLGLRDSGSRVRLVSASAELLGITYGDAAAMVLQRVPDQATLAARQKQFDKDFKDFDSRKALVNAGIATDGWFSSPDQVPEPVARAYEKSLRLHYDLMGDPKIAEAAANKRFKEEYGVTGVGGVKSVVKAPPENFFPGASNTSLTVDQKSALIDADARRGYTLLGVKPGTVVEGQVKEDVYDVEGNLVAKKTEAGDISGIPDHSLVYDQLSEQDRAAGRPVSFELRIRNNYGNHVPIPIEGKSGNLRYVMPTIEQLQAMPEYGAITMAAEKSAQKKKEFTDALYPDMRRYPYGPRKDKK